MEIHKKWLTSDKCHWQYLGASIHKGNKWVFITLFLNFVVIIAILGIRYHVWDVDWLNVFAERITKVDTFGAIPLKHITFIFSSLVCVFIGLIVHYLTPIFCLRKQESRITWSQILFLVSIGLCIVFFVKMIDPKKDSVDSLLLGGAGLVLAWVFQDTIKSVAAFFYLRLNGLLKIGDWILVPSHQIDGMVKRISLTTVTVENWDTTTSSFPTYILHAEHFKNCQDMMEGKTHGRQMMKTFVIDTGWFHPLTESETIQIKKHTSAALQPFVSHDIYVGKSNMTAFREYVYQMLLCNTKVSHYPRLVVRWQEQVHEGMPLQLYVFITESRLAAFEWEQSKIIEQVVESLPWFGLQLFQRPSGFDTSNSNIYLSRKPAKYEKEYEEQ